MEEKGFLATIFDFSFSEFVTTKVIKFLLGLAMVGVGIWVIVMIITGFASDAWWMGLIFLILSPVIYLILMLLARIYLELIIVIFRIAEDLNKIRESLTSGQGGGDAGTPAA
jgi:hypothetical protein